MCPWLYDVFQQLSHVRHIIQTKYIICHMCIVSILLYIVGWVHQFKVHHSSHTYANGKSVILH